MKKTLYTIEDTLRDLDPARFFLIAGVILSIFYTCNISYLRFVPHEKGRFLHAVHLALNVVGITDRIPVSFVEVLSRIDTPNDPNSAMMANACHWTPQRNAKFCHPFPPGYKTPDFWQLATIELNFKEKIRFESYIFAAEYPFIGYIFYALGAGLGMLFGFPPIIIMYLSIVTNAAAALALGYFTIKIMPALRWPACYLLLLPGAFQIRALVMPDAITIELCLLTVAIALHLLYFPRLLTKKELFGLVLLGFLTGFIKLAYFLVPLIYSIIPLSCFGNARLKYAVVSLAVLASIGAGMGWAWHFADTYYSFDLHSNYPGTLAPYERKFNDIFFHPLTSLGVISTTISKPSWIFHILENLMFRRNHVKLLFSLLPAIVLTLLAEDPERINDRWLRATAFAIFIATLLVLCIGMYFHRDWPLESTPYLIQGRYLLPVLPCLLLAAHSLIRFSPPAQALARMEAQWIMIVWLVWLHWPQVQSLFF